MAEKRASAGARAWRILRLALLWARKGGTLRRWRIILNLRVALKGLRAGSRGRHIRCMERELSFDETPTFNFKMRKPASLRLPKFPCITSASADLDTDEEDWIFYRGEKECKIFNKSARSEECCSNDEDYGNDDDDEDEECDCEELEYGEGEEEGIDSKAEEFIAKFYEQMKLQRQVSWVQYNEMLQRGVS